MISPDRSGMVAPCGIDCGICELHSCKDNPELMKHFVSRGIPREKLPCAGCRNVKGLCPVIGEQCATFSCVSSKSVDFCGDCGDFPCEKLNPAADRAEILPHNTKVFNLCTIKNRGIEEFIQRSSEIKARYYRGKMAIGRGPQLG